MIEPERRLGKQPSSESLQLTSGEILEQLAGTIRVARGTTDERTRENLLRRVVQCGIGVLKAPKKQDLRARFTQLLLIDPETARDAYDILQTTAKLSHTHETPEPLREMLGLPLTGPAFPDQQPKQG